MTIILNYEGGELWIVLTGQRRPSKQSLKTLEILSYFLTTLKHMFKKALGIQSKLLGKSHGLEKFKYEKLKHEKNERKLKKILNLTY